MYSAIHRQFCDGNRSRVKISDWSGTLGVYQLRTRLKFYMNIGFMQEERFHKYSPLLYLLCMEINKLI